MFYSVFYFETNDEPFGNFTTFWLYSGPLIIKLSNSRWLIELKRKY